jgi:hypothetical protein
MRFMVTFEGYRDNQTNPVREYGILPGVLPGELLNLHDTATMDKYWEDTRPYFIGCRKMLGSEEVLYSGQEYVDMGFVKRMTPSDHGESDIIVGVDSTGKKWLLNGHHRLVYDRVRGRDSYVFLFGPEDISELDDMFYSEEE